MSKMKVEVIPCSATPLIYDEEKCIGCNACAEICQCDIILPNPEKGKPPIVMFPGECYYCKIRLGKAGTRKLEGD